MAGVRGSAWWLAVGWALHPVWDVALHLVGGGRVFTPQAYPVACLSWDTIVAGAIAWGIVHGTFGTARLDRDRDRGHVAVG